MKETERYKKALATWGTEAQLDMMVEECAELINAIQKCRRHRVESVVVLEEGVDVEIMLNQLKIILKAPTAWNRVKRDKLQRLENVLVQLPQAK